MKATKQQSSFYFFLKKIRREVQEKIGINRKAILKEILIENFKLKILFTSFYIGRKKKQT